MAAGSYVGVFSNIEIRKYHAMNETRINRYR